MTRPLAALLLALPLGAAALAGCGGGEERASLAIDRAERHGDAIEITTECASDLEAEVRPDPAGSGLLQISVWGAPEVGRCASELAIIGVPVDQTKVVDAATGQVVDITPEG